MMQFSKCEKLISSAVGQEARERYLEFARTIDLYKSDLVNTWTLRANEILNELSTPILTNRVNKQTLSEKQVVSNEICKSSHDSTITKRTKKSTSTATTPELATLETSFPQKGTIALFS